MAAPDSAAPLRIVHVLRAPLGGLFRHVVDVAREQVARGHSVGLLTDSLTGGEQADRMFGALAPDLRLGVTRIPMHRNPGPRDIPALLAVMARIRTLAPDVVHGHGSKGGLYARAPALLRRSAIVRAYTPHGGSFNYRPGTLVHRLYMATERVLERATDLFLFESAYIAGRYAHFVGAPHPLARVALNGLSEGEFVTVAPNADAADFVYVGELRSAKGIDTLIEAIARASAISGRRLTAVLVGSGPDKEALQQQAAALGFGGQISFPGPLPARTAFTLGRVMVVPSRAESLPYVVLEAAGAQIPMISTDVGGIPEIFGPYRDRLISPDDPQVLADAMFGMLGGDDSRRRAQAAELAAYVRAHFSVQTMTDAVLASYREALAQKGGAATKISGLAAPR